MVVPPGLGAELVLVDNSPDDDIGPIVEAVSDRLPLPIACLREPTHGLGAARNCGLKGSTGEIVAFTDDDCRVDPDWLCQIAARFARDPQLMLLGGRVELFDPADAPITVLRGSAPARLSSTADIFGFLHGCNMAFRRSLADRIGRFNPTFGSGSPVDSGDDAELVYRAFRSGASTAYEPKAVVYHDHGRRTRRSTRSKLMRYQQANGAILAKHARSGDEAAARLLREVVWAPLATLTRWPLSPDACLRASYRAVLYGLGAVRYRVFAARLERGAQP